MVSPFGGDGGDTHRRSRRRRTRRSIEYVGLNMALTTNGGMSNGTAPGRTPSGRSRRRALHSRIRRIPATRLRASSRRSKPDLANPDLWIAGGRYVWINDPGGVAKGWDTTCRAVCLLRLDRSVGDSGAGHSITQVGHVAMGPWYAAWCGPCNADGFARGILTNHGGSVHQLALPSDFPNRFIQGLVVDRRTTRTTPTLSSAASLGGGRARSPRARAMSSRRWTVGERGPTSAWNLPDAPGDDLVLTPSGHLVVGERYRRLLLAELAREEPGTASAPGFRTASTNDVQLSPAAATSSPPHTAAVSGRSRRRKRLERAAREVAPATGPLRYSAVTYAAVRPPSTRKVAPFTYDDSSLARKSAP